MPIYLGLDSSTQSVTATAVDIDDQHPDRRAILFERTFRYDEALPSYGTHHGVLRSADPRTVHAPPLMWSEALDRMMADLARETSVDWRRLRAISGSAQQHGSVYVNARAGERVGTLDAAQPLADQLGDVFSRTTSPIWMDSSTTRQCAAIEEALGGARALARLTGSRAFERFTGPQIRKFAEDEPEAYAATDRVHLVSSWLASLLAGTHAAIDPGDGSGMNLMDLAAKQWSPAAVRATAPGLDAKLPPLAESWTRRRDALALLAAALRLPRGAGRRLVRRQPVQPGRHGPRARGSRRGLARNERHDLRHHALAAPERGRHRPCVRLADGRLYGHVGLQERVARARARA